MASATNNNNLLGMSWQDHFMAHNINKENVLAYFSQRSNRFYDCTCNNETIKMQNRSLQHLQDMKGVEYILVHHQEPILFIIRKQKRLGPRQVETIADYYIIAGTVYQAPDFGSVINSRLMTTMHHLDNAFKETLANARYHPAKGYSWHSDEVQNSAIAEKNRDKKRDDQPASAFQHQRVGILLTALAEKYPFKFAKAETSEQPPVKVVAPKRVEKPADEDSKEKVKSMGDKRMAKIGA